MASVDWSEFDVNIENCGRSSIASAPMGTSAGLDMQLACPVAELCILNGPGKPML